MEQTPVINPIKCVCQIQTREPHFRFPLKNSFLRKQLHDQCLCAKEFGGNSLPRNFPTKLFLCSVMSECACNSKQKYGPAQIVQPRVFNYDNFSCINTPFFFSRLFDRRLFSSKDCFTGQSPGIGQDGSDLYTGGPRMCIGEGQVQAGLLRGLGVCCSGGGAPQIHMDIIFCFFRPFFLQ